MKKGIYNILLYIFLPSIVPLFFTMNMHSLTYKIVMFITYLVLTLFFVYKYRELVIKSYKEFNSKSFFKSFIIFLLCFGIMVLSNYIINYIIIPNGMSSNEINSRTLLKENVFMYSVLFSIIIPFIEEVVFRVEFKNSLKNKYVYLIVTSLIFSILHNLGDTSLIELLYLIPYFILGFTFSLIYYKENNIIYNTIFHSLNNLITIIIVLFF